jgi:chromosome segregation ATPase
VEDERRASEGWAEKLSQSETRRLQMETELRQLKEVSALYNIFYKAHSNMQKIKSDNVEERLRSLENQIRSEEAARRDDLLQKLQQMHMHRDNLQKSLNIALQNQRQSAAEYETRISREKEQNQSLQAELSQLSSQHSACKEQLTNLQQQSHMWAEKDKSVSDKLDKAEREITRLETDKRRLERELERCRESEVNRAKELERAIVSYVRTVERSES